MLEQRQPEKSGPLHLWPMASDTMKTSLLRWLDHDFVEIRCEARRGATAAEQGEDVFNQARTALAVHGLTLAHTLRSRVFGVDRAARDAVSQSRFAALAGESRAASSSYIAPKLFSSDALVALELIAARPRAGIAKIIRAYDPPKAPICSISFGALLVLSGNTSELPTLARQLGEDILPRIGQYLAEAGSSWECVAQICCYLHESQNPAALMDRFRAGKIPLPPRFEVQFVEGYSAPGKLVEVEVTALRDPDK